MKPLGDTHNFGQFVRQEGSWIVKPRPIFWEELFLGENSILRDFLRSKTKLDPFKWYPSLKFKYCKSFAMPYSGKVEKYHLATELGVDQRELSSAIGALLGNCLFWGISDLHVGNVAMGLSRDRNINVFPLDVESLFFDIKLLSHSYLLKSVINKHQIVGVNRFLDKEILIEVLLKSFINLIEYYHDNFELILKFLRSIDLNGIPIRCILKNTSTYYRNIKSLDNSLFFNEEIDQIKRGDIPYFYTYIDSGEIFYLSEFGETRISRKWSEAFQGATYSPIMASSLIKKTTKSQLTVSILQILRNFDPGSDRKIKSENCAIEYKGTDIFYSDSVVGGISCKRL